ncbi:MAG: hypothetical protein GY748_08095 [Planctomycetaceae bacterium]|nr:hypothetical protein [Planctomycetaceae bacterium]
MLSNFFHLIPAIYWGINQSPTFKLQDKNMKTVELLAIIISLSSAFFFSNAANTNQPPNQVTSQPIQQPATDGDFEPVDNMHHFMEYICEPSYKGLKQVLATEPADRKAWKAFKNHALVLAESSALVAARGPEDEAKNKQWKAISADVYQSGKSLYKSAGNYSEAKKHYGTMLDACNRCHTVFAKGKYQLSK